MIKHILFVVPCVSVMTLFTSNGMAIDYGNCDTTQAERCLDGTPGSGRSPDSPNLYCYETTECGCGYRSKSECEENKGTYQTCCKKKGDIMQYCYRSMTCVSCVHIGNDWIIDYSYEDNYQNSCYQYGGSQWQTGFTDITGTYNLKTSFCSSQLYDNYNIKCYVAVDNTNECE